MSEFTNSLKVEVLTAQNRVLKEENAAFAEMLSKFGADKVKLEERVKGLFEIATKLRDSINANELSGSRWTQYHNASNALFASLAADDKLAGGVE